MTWSILRCIAIAILVYQLVEDIYARPKEARYANEKSTPNIVLDPIILAEMKVIKLEVLKEKIMKELDFAEPPETAASHPLPKRLLQMSNISLAESEPEDEEEITEDPLNDESSCILENGTECEKFEFKLPGQNRSINFIEIWLKKITSNELLNISISLCSHLERGHQNCSKEETIQEERTELNWTSFEIPLKFLLTNEIKYRYCIVKVLGANFENQGLHKPFLNSRVANPSERRRRSASRFPNKVCKNQCCKVDFYISFKDIGWNFVIAPNGFYANMCYGKCSTTDTLLNLHHTLLNLALANKTSNGEKKEPAWTPCCSPTELKPLNMFYRATNYTEANSTYSILHRDIPNMITESCRCW